MLLSQHSFKVINKIWTAFVIITLAILLYLIPQSRVNSNLFDLLPTQTTESYNQALLDGYLTTLDNQLIWLISDNDGENAASFWSNELKSIPEIINIESQKDEAALNDYAKFLLENPSILPKNIIDMIGNNEYLDWISAQIYSPFSGLTIGEITADPLLSTRSYLLEQLKDNGHFSMVNGWITISPNDQKQWFLIRAELHESASGMLQRKEIVSHLDQKIEKLKTHYPEHELLQKGSLFYGDYAAKTAEKDITTIGVLSILGVILIFYLFFRSFNAILLTLLALSIGILFGITSVLLIYGEIHLITIVMSTSIIGVSIDYTLFYLTSRALEGDKYTPYQSLRKVLNPLLGALLSTCLAYAVLIFAPFVGLEQLAIFTISGLIAVFFTIIAWFPKLTKLPTKSYPALIKLINSYLLSWLSHKAFILSATAVLIVITLLGIAQLTADDDIGNLQTLPKNILAQDQKISQILNQHETQQVLMVVGDTEEALLQNIENSYSLLDQWQEDNIIKSYRKLPFYSQKQQKENLQILQNFYPELQQHYQDNGIENLSTPDFNHPISLKNWLESPISEGWKLLFQILPTQESAFIIPITKVYEPKSLIASLSQAQENGAIQAHSLYWVDRKSELSELFATYRITMQWLLVVSLTIISAIFIIAKGFRAGCLFSFPILMAVLTPLSIMGWFGITVNLFTVMALILVIGISIDYILFFGSKNQPNIAFITILLAAIISELTFGLLAASNTNAIANFGLVLALGVFTALLLAPYARYSIFNTKDSLS